MADIGNIAALIFAAAIAENNRAGKNARLMSVCRFVAAAGCCGWRGEWRLVRF